MSKLVLHIGTHKTGTTSFQQTLKKNHALAAKHDLIYPLLPRGHHGLVTDWVCLPEHYHYGTPPQHHWKKLTQTYADSDKTVLISSEEFSRGDPKHRVNLHQIREWTEGFDKVQVICSLRDQLSLLQSIYLEIIKNNPAILWQNYFHTAIETRYAAGVFLDYNQLYKHLADAFEPHEIFFVPFNDAKKADGGLIGHILKIIDASEFARNLEPVSANISTDALQSWVSLMISRPQIADHKLINHVGTELKKRFSDGKKTTLYSRDEPEIVRQTFDPLNQSFQKRLSTFSETALNLVFPDPDKLVYRDDLDAWFWSSLTKTIWIAQMPR